MAVRDKAIQERCNGCGICLACCPQDVFRIEQKKAVIVYNADCVACWGCEDFCPCDCLEVTPERLHPIPSPI